MPGIPDDHLVLVLYGDVPLIGRATLAALLALAGPQRLALLTVRLEDPTGYGRIVRNARGQVQKIVEETDATPRQRTIRECNTGVLAAPAHLLRGWLARLTTDNSQGEYYLTDVIALAVRDRVAVRPLRHRERRPRCSASTTRRSWRSSRRSAARARRASCWPRA